MSQPTLSNLLQQEKNTPNLYQWEKTKRRWAKDLGYVPKSAEIRSAYDNLLESGDIEKDASLERSLQVKKMRSISGVIPIAVMMGPHPCPGRCTFCIQEDGYPKSYMSDEPAAIRAKALNFDPAAQLKSRLQQLELNGHQPEKLQIIVLGGTFSSYPNDYKQDFLKGIFDGANGRVSSTIQESHALNETAKYKIIGMSIETRPDWVTQKEIELLRKYGVTKVQLGVQALNERIYQNIRRNHSLDHVRNATRLLRNAGLKINYHFMPNLPGSNPELDIQMFEMMFEDPGFKPDTIKLYPCITIPKTPLHRQWLRGEYQSYDDATLAQVLAECKRRVPYYCRIDRVVRDISRHFTASGTTKTNFRQHLESYLKDNNIHCKCIRCREVRDVHGLNVEMGIRNYKTDGGTESFISAESPKFISGMIRLRLPDPHGDHSTTIDTQFFPELAGAAIIRELQVFGSQAHTKIFHFNATQHKGLGKRLIQMAEAHARENGFEKMAVIAGVGVRGYYRKLGYELEGTYMIKQLT